MIISPYGPQICRLELGPGAFHFLFYLYFAILCYLGPVLCVVQRYGLHFTKVFHIFGGILEVISHVHIHVLDTSTSRSLSSIAAIYICMFFPYFFSSLTMICFHPFRTMQQMRSKKLPNARKRNKSEIANLHGTILLLWLFLYGEVARFCYPLDSLQLLVLRSREPSKHC